MTQDEPTTELADPAAFERWVRIEKTLGRVAMLIVPLLAVGVPVIAAQTSETTLVLIAQVLMFAVIVPVQFVLWRETQTARVRARLQRVQSANSWRLGAINGVLAVVWFTLALAGLSWWRGGQAWMQGR